MAVRADRTHPREEERDAVAQPPPAPAPAARTSAGDVLALQRAHGNQAVAAMIARTPEDGSGGATATQHPTLVDSAPKDWDKAVAAKKWEDAVNAGKQLTPAQLGPKLDALSFEQITALSDQAARMLPWTAGIWFAIEPFRVKKLDALYEAAVNGEKWDKALPLLDAYRDPDVLPKARKIKAKGAAKLAAAAAAAKAAWADDNHRVRRTLSFLEVEDLTGAAVRPIDGTSVTGTTWDPAVKVPETGGKVSYGSGGTGGGATNWYGLKYEGADAQQTGWIQFIARNIEKRDDKDASLGFHTGNWSGEGQNARKFSTPSAPVWHLDTLSDQAPFYEAASKAAGGGQGASEITARKTVMFDAPGGGAALVAPMFTDPKVKKVISRVQFDTYLVKEMQVLRHETITVTFEFDAAQAAAGDPGAKNTHTGGGPVSSLPADRYKAMTQRFPKFAYLPHG